LAFGQCREGGQSRGATRHAFFPLDLLAGECKRNPTALSLSSQVHKPRISATSGSPWRLNHLDHLFLAWMGSNFTWGIVALRKGKMTIEGGYL